MRADENTSKIINAKKNRLNNFSMIDGYAASSRCPSRNNKNSPIQKKRLRLVTRATRMRERTSIPLSVPCTFRTRIRQNKPASRSAVMRGVGDVRASAVATGGVIGDLKSKI